jgi:1,4-alpha-glucan branching enzyme
MDPVDLNSVTKGNKDSSGTVKGSNLPEAVQRIINARHHDPFSVLGLHPCGAQDQVRVYLPRAEKAFVGEERQEMQRLPGTDIFEWVGVSGSIEAPYRIYWKDKSGDEHSQYDPYTFPPQISDYDLHLFGEGKHWHIYRVLGAHPHEVNGIKGILFATWAPNAERVSVIGEFNQWDGRCNPMRVRGGSGVWEIFIPELEPGMIYRYEIRSREYGTVQTKSDPYAQQFELRPSNASIVTSHVDYQWNDQGWIDARKNFDWLHRPISVYEVHLGSWQRDEHGRFLNYRELADRIVGYVCELGFTHIELLPITEHPFDASWGYQTTGYYAPTSRFGSPDDFRYFVDHCHQHGIGVILDWVPAHFPKDSHGLAFYDGSALYEHEDPRRGEHRDWGTLIYNYGRNEVKNFLLASAMYWLEEYHLDGLRVDAVASMLYLDYSREQGDWVPNIYGGNENIEAIEFLRELNSVTHAEHPGVLISAEESTAWPQVTRPVWVGGLGFTLKWNMGWMHDTLLYMSKDPVHRHYHHDQLTFGLLYAFTENFVLPFSHDEMVHGKGSMLNKMPGDEWQRFAGLRLLYTYMFTYPGKKLLFMGSEFGQGVEWDFDKALDWHLLDYHYHQGVRQITGDLNRLYRDTPALHTYDFEEQGFEWIDCHDSAQSVLSYVRKNESEFVVVVLNFTPVPRHNYRIGMPAPGTYREVLNSDSMFYGGSNTGNELMHTEPIHWMNRTCSLQLTLPPMAGIVLKLTD